MAGCGQALLALRAELSLSLHLWKPKRRACHPGSDCICCFRTFSAAQIVSLWSSCPPREGGAGEGTGAAVHHLCWQRAEPRVGGMLLHWAVLKDAALAEVLMVGPIK